MERSEPSLIPEWLKGASGNVLASPHPGLYQDGGNSSLSRPRASQQVAGGHTDFDSPHYTASAERSSFSSGRRSHGSSAVDRTKMDRESHSQARLNPSLVRSSSSKQGYTTQIRDKERTEVRDWVQDGERSVWSKEEGGLSGNSLEERKKEREHFENGRLRLTIPGISGSHESDAKLRRPQSMGLSPRTFESNVWKQTEVATLTPSASIQKAAFERNFPSLGVDDKSIGALASSASSPIASPRPLWQSPLRSDLGRASSPGLMGNMGSPSTTSMSMNNVSGGSDHWNSVLVEIPLSSDNTQSISLGMSALMCSTSTPSYAVSPGSIPATTGTLLNMAEALSQGPPRVCTPPQSSADSQRLEELALKQSRQLIPMTPSLPKTKKTQWERYLPLVEFAYNNTIHSSTGKVPFEIVEGAMKVPPFLSTKHKIFEADEYTRDLDMAFAKVSETLQKSQERQKKAAYRHRRDLKLKENDWVLLRFEKARLRKKKGKERLFPKLNSKCISCESVETFGDVPDDGKPDEQPVVEQNESMFVPEQSLSDKGKSKINRIVDVGRSSSISKPDPVKHVQGKLLVLKANKDGVLATAALKSEGSIIAQSSPHGLLGMGTSPIIGIGGNGQHIKSHGRRGSHLNGNIVSSGGVRSKDLMEDKRLAQAQNRSDFFNTLRRKAAGHGNTNTVTNSDSQKLDGVRVSSEAAVLEETATAVHVPGMKLSGGGADCNFHVHSNGVTDSQRKNLITEEVLCIDCNSSVMEECAEEVVCVDSEEEEAAFMRSLGWEENGEDSELTEEEINAFYQMREKKKLSGNDGHGFDVTVQPSYKIAEVCLSSSESESDDEIHA
ncbi:hypothetical protein L7F22_060737 [Adiantum nelumboides]|nr:hypothetical protein [Adiantum nelumboides]